MTIKPEGISKTILNPSKTHHTISQTPVHSNVVLSASLHRFAGPCANDLRDGSDRRHSDLSQHLTRNQISPPASRLLRNLSLALRSAIFLAPTTPTKITCIAPTLGSGSRTSQRGLPSYLLRIAHVLLTFPCESAHL